MTDSVYVWQYAWTPPVAQGIARAAGIADTFMVLCGDVDARKPALERRTVPVAWNELAKTGRPVWAVVRVNHALTKHLERSCDGAADWLAELFRGVLSDAQRSGVSWRGVQLDYDCPTESLGGYAALMKALRIRMPETVWSITALPTWLGHSEFRDVVEGLDHFVLQVHSLDRPRRVDDAVTLCDTKRIADWARQASKFGAPYYIALPTYGYRLYFRSDGEFAGLGAENTSTAPAGATTREICADPVAVAEAVRALHANPPPHCRGVVWFRMPVETDRLNWSWDVLREVIAGRAPQWAITAEVRNVKEGLYEVWVRNGGGYHPAKPLHISFRCNAAKVVASDYVNSFHGKPSADSTTDELTGPAPEPGESAMAAWYRISSATEGITPTLNAQCTETVQ